MFVKIIYRHFVFNQEKYQVCKFRIYRHFVKSVNGSNFPVLVATEWNSHRIRKNRMAECPSGVPDELYFLSELSGKAVTE